MKQIRESDADIINLCEVDHLNDCYGPQLTEMGYEYMTETRKGLDSVLIAYKKQKFELVSRIGVQHDMLADTFDPVKPGHPNDFKRGNCSLILVL